MAAEAPEWVRGWLVVRNYPPQFGAFFADRPTAEAKARELGADYKVRPGRHLPGTTEFSWLGREER
jgi:hypothetical protein